MFSDETNKESYSEKCINVPILTPTGGQKGFSALTNIMATITVLDVIAQIAFLAIFPDSLKLVPVVAEIIDIWLVCLLPTPVNNNSLSPYLSAFTLGTNYQARKTGTLLRFFATLALIANKIIVYILLGAFASIG